MAEPDVIPSEQMYADALARSRAAEARVEAAEQALREIVHMGERWNFDPGTSAGILVAAALAALACPPQQPEPSGTFGGGYGRPEPHHLREFGAACPPPEEEK